MTHAIQKTSSTQWIITVAVPYSELKLLLPKAAERISNETEIEGFRKGKAPYEVVRQKLGEFKILEEAVRMHIEKNFAAIMTEVKERDFKGEAFEPVGSPAVSITKLAPGADVEYKLTLFILPPVKLPDYKTIAKEVLAGKNAAAVTDEEAATAINWLRDSRVKLVTVNRGAQSGDRVEAGYSGKLGGVTMEGLQSRNQPFILGQNRFIPGFEEQIVGMKAGEEKTFSLAVPGDYQAKNIAGKNIEFMAAVNLVQQRDIPEWNDAFAETLGEFKSIAEVEKNIREGLLMEKEAQERERLRMSMIEKIAEEGRAEIPEPLIGRELEKMTAELGQAVSGMGLKLEDYLAHIKKTTEDLKVEWKKDAEKRVKIALLLREISRKESIQPSEEEVQAAVNRTVAHRDMTEDDVKKVDPVRGKSPAATAAPSARASNGVDREAFINYNRGVARNEKVFEFLENQE